MIQGSLSYLFLFIPLLAFSQSNNPIGFSCPADWINTWNYLPFETERQFFAIYKDEQQVRHSRVVEVNGKDTLIDTHLDGRKRFVRMESKERPEFYIWNVPLQDGQVLSGRHFPYGKMLYPGEAVHFGRSYLYAMGKPQVNEKASEDSLIGIAATYPACAD